MRLFQDEGGLIAFAPSLIARPLNEAMLPSWGTGGLLFLPVDLAMGRTWSGQPSDGSLPETLRQASDPQSPLAR